MDESAPQAKKKKTALLYMGAKMASGQPPRVQHVDSCKKISNYNLRLESQVLRLFHLSTHEQPFFLDKGNNHAALQKVEKREGAKGWKGSRKLDHFGDGLLVLGTSLSIDEQMMHHMFPKHSGLQTTSVSLSGESTTHS